VIPNRFQTAIRTAFLVEKELRNSRPPTATSTSDRTVPSSESATPIGGSPPEASGVTFGTRSANPVRETNAAAAARVNPPSGRPAA
jgi:hypothetical protein